MYSKKVMELFKNPKNMGEIKNADGVGKIGNPVCLLPWEMIHSNPETVAISEISKKDEVLGFEGRFNSIIDTYYRKYDGKIIELKNKLGKIALTPEHLIYAIKIPRGGKFLRNSGKKELAPAWYHAEDLRMGDIVLYPILKEQKDKKFIEIDIIKSKWDFNSKKLPKNIPINNEFLRLCGYFLSEGNIQNKPCRTYISFTFNINEKDLVKDVKVISKKLFGLSVKIAKRPERKTVAVYLYSAILARLFEKLFGNYAENKKMPEFMLLLPLKKQTHLIYSLWKGDGYVNLNRDGPRAGYSTISYQLAQQIKLLLMRQSIAPSIYCETEKLKNGVKHKKNYRIHVGQRDSLEKLCAILGIKYVPKSYKSIESWFDSSYLYTPITKIEKFNYSGNVYNLEVKNSHSFSAEAFCLHNCGDMMHLYIKIAKNKQGKEIIKDIKVKTFGCVAAISTSSAITELAKGKTLEEAKKISNKDIVDVVEGLPPQKLHCSVLAADALKKAIEDYEEKKK